MDKTEEKPGFEMNLKERYEKLLKYCYMKTKDGYLAEPQVRGYRQRDGLSVYNHQKALRGCLVKALAT